VKSTHPYIFGVGANQVIYAVAHFAGGFVGKSEYQYIKSVYTVADQVRNPVGNNPRFARPGACNYHHRPFYLLYRRLLFRV
jgi:hypothetical protein